MPRPAVALPPGSMLTGRTVIAVVLLFAAGLSAVLGVTAGWTRNQLLDTETWTATSSAIANDPAVQNTVASAIADQIVASADVEAALRDALPGPLSSLVEPLTNGASSIVEQAVVQVVRTDAFALVWDSAVRAAHHEFVADLNGNGKVTSIGPGGLYLDLGGVLQSVRTALDDTGITMLDSIDLSGISVKILLVDAPGLQNLRKAVDALKLAVIVLPAIALCCLVAGLVIARRRWVAMFGLGVGVLLGAATVLVVEFFGHQRAVDALIGGVLDRGGAEAVVNHVTASLRPLVLLWAIIGVGIAVVSGVILVMWERRRTRILAGTM